MSLAVLFFQAPRQMLPATELAIHVGAMALEALALPTRHEGKMEALSMSPDQAAPLESKITINRVTSEWKLFPFSKDSIKV